MSEPGIAAPRPTRLSPAFQILAGFVVLLSFLSGLVLCQGHLLQTSQMEPPSWLHRWRVLHGSLNPLLCVLFGYLWHRHILQGWRTKANRKSGIAMATVFGGLILTGVGLYYFPMGTAMFWTHAALGFILPLGLAAHLIAARIWAKEQALKKSKIILAPETESQ